MILAIVRSIKSAGSDKSGFTLIELIAVLAVLAIISAIAVPRFTSTINVVKQKADKASAQIIARAAEQKWLDDGSNTGTDGYTASELVNSGYLKGTPKVQNDDTATDFYAAIDDEGKCTGVYYGTSVGEDSLLTD